MIRTLAWKEYREHRSIWIAIGTLAPVCLASLFAFVDPPGSIDGHSDKTTLMLLAAGILACTYGLVCGSMMLAGEREAGTLTFLDTLPRSRSQLWRTKLAVGLTLTTLQAVWITATFKMLAGSSSHAEDYGPPLLLGLLLLSLDALCWGMLFSAWYQRVLSAAAMTALVLVTLCLGTLMLAEALGWVMFAGRLFLTAFALRASWRIFCGQERKQTLGGGNGGHSTRALLWLSFRQGRVVSTVIYLAAFLLGLGIYAADMLSWPVATFVVGVACGTCVFAGEQIGGTQRFLGDRRLPPGRVWAVKVGSWLARAVCASLLVGLGQMVVSYADGPRYDFRTAAQVWAGIEGQHPSQARAYELAAQPGRGLPPDVVLSYDLSAAGDIAGTLFFLVLWPVYGFGIGQFCALVFRKTAAAVVVALLSGAGLLALWLPSLLVGGVSWWQPFVLPVCLLLATRTAMWPWMSGTLTTPRTVASLTSWVLLAGASVAGSLWYRVVEFPEMPPPYQLASFRASLPSPEENEAGRLIRRAAAEYSSHESQVTEKLGLPKKTLAPAPAGMGGMAGAMAPAAPVAPPPQDVPGAPAGMPPGMGLVPGGAADGGSAEVHESYLDQAAHVQGQGWSKDATELGRWLDAVVEGDWMKHLQQAAPLPLGVVEDPRGLTPSSPLASLQSLREASIVLAARALQLQARGDDKGALDMLSVLLALSRNLRHRTVCVSYLVGLASEQAALQALDRWQKNLKNQPKLLRRALDELSRHERQTPPLSECQQADYLVQFGSGEVPAHVLQVLSRNETSREPLLRQRIELLEGAWQVPWERERYLRQIRMVMAMQLPPQIALDWGKLPVFLGGWQAVDSRVEPQQLARVRQKRVKLALALYRLEVGKPPQNQEDLVPRYLPELLLDPERNSVLPLSDGDGKKDAPDGGPGDVE